MAGAVEAGHVVEISGEPLTIEQLDARYGQRVSVSIDERIWARVDAGRRAIERILASGSVVYGVNTGFGALKNKRIPTEQLDALQTNLILSHAVGVGPPMPDELVRWMMLFKIAALAHGYSGVRRAPIECLTEFLRHDLLPVIPTQGSLGASGDLAPLAHMVLPMIGRGELRAGGRVLRASDALSAHGLRSISLAPKEGLALINGTQFMSAYGAALVIRAERLCRHADIIATMSLDGLQGSVAPFDQDLNRLRPHHGAVAVARNVRKLMAGSQILESHADCEKVQDPYSLRCIAQVHGAVRDAVEHAHGVFETEINSVTDNPIVFDEHKVISGGLFHGQPLALVLDYLAMALTELAGISERRTYLLLSGHDGLPELLMKDTGINSGFMLPQYTAAALVSECKGLSHPASVDSIPTSLGQEDHVSMGATAATKAWRVIENAETVLAIEMMCAAQALDYRAPLAPGVGPRIAHRVVRAHLMHAEQDRLFGEDMQTALALLRSQKVSQVVELEVGEL
ncbi:MAG TPA: histidine ammonia-lyase [Phycisphaerae bacterium]|jgi:histidine ammonia-lyase